MKITQVRSATCIVPLRKPVTFANNHVAARDYHLVWVTADNGLSGFGYGMGSRRPEGIKLLHAAAHEQLAPLILGQDPWMSEHLWEKMYRHTALLGRRGAVLRALSAMDIAIWDLKAKSVGLPLYKLLGGHRDVVPAYASGGYYLEGKGVDGLVAELEDYRARGFRNYKIKVGVASPREDGERLRACREALGPDARIALDANNAWSTLVDALSYTRQFEPHDPWWLEEPFFPEQTINFEELAGRTTIPLAAGEVDATRWPFRDLIDRRAVHFFQHDATVCGGVTEWRRITALCESFDLPVAPHWVTDIHAHLVAASPNGLTVEYFIPEHDIVNFEKLVREPLQVRDGMLALRQTPGHGVSIDPAPYAAFVTMDTHPGEPVPV